MERKPTVTALTAAEVDSRIKRAVINHPTFPGMPSASRVEWHVPVHGRRALVFEKRKDARAYVVANAGESVVKLKLEPRK